MKNIKQDFPIFQTYPELVYLDSAATSQKPQAVIDAVVDFYRTKNSNVHRGIYHLAEEATQTYEATRKLIADFIQASSEREIVFTVNTNYAINLVAQGWGKKFLQAGDIIILSEMEHHANIVPWLRLKEEIGIELIFLPVNEDGRLDYKNFINNDSSSEQSESRNSSTSSGGNSSRTALPVDRQARIINYERIKLLSLTHASNVLGTINPIPEIVTYFKQINPEIKTLIDAAQSVPHLPVDVKALGCDFLAFSSHKMLGPSGVGVLWAKEAVLDEMDPYITGSHMIKTVSKDKVTWADLPDKFEAGTGNLEGVVGLGAAINYLQAIGMENISNHEQELTKYALEKLHSLPYLQIFGPKTVEDRLGIFSIGIKGLHPHDIAQVLDSNKIAVRSGHHCCQVLMKQLKTPATARVSLYLYNTKTDIDRLLEGLEVVKRTFSI